MSILKKYFWLAIVALTSPFFALAQSSGGRGGTVTIPDPLNADSISGILNNIIDFLLVIAGPIAVIMTIWAGFLFMTAGGNQEKVIQARSTLLYVVIGVAVLILSKAIVSFVESII